MEQTPSAPSEGMNGAELPSNQPDMPPLTRAQVLHCSYHSWHPRYRSITPKARLIPLSDSFIEYLREDGIFLPPDDISPTTDDDTWLASEGYSSDEDTPDPSTKWPEIHARVKEIIAELGGAVSPKLNWRAPTDAAFMIPTNRLECKTPNDVYLLLKSSNAVSLDIDHPFVDCAPEVEKQNGQESKEEDGEQGGEKGEVSKIPYHLVLRKFVNINPALEFRCFVRDRRLIGISQRDTKHYAFLRDMKDDLGDVILAFFNDHLRDSFSDPNFVFDVYVPAPHTRVWLMDIGPFGYRTDPLQFTWEYLLDKELPSLEDSSPDPEINGQTVRLYLRPGPGHESGHVNGADQDDEVEEIMSSATFRPEFLLASSAGPANLGSADNSVIPPHKVPQDVLDASETPGGMGELLEKWRDVLEQKIKEDAEYSSDEDK